MSVEFYTQFFKDTDTDNSGSLSLSELSEKLKGKVEESKIQGMFRSCDSSGDNKVSLDEFLIAMGVQTPTDAKKNKLRQIFREFDVNGDGTISREELAKALNKSETNKAEIDRILALADADGDKKISYDEFVTKVFPQ